MAREIPFDRDTVASRLTLALGSMGMQVDRRQQTRLLELIALLLHWNRAFNLTAVRDPVRMVPHHLLDSLVLEPFIEGKNILDVGTGAGFPGLPLAIVQPKRNFVLLDSNGKKVRFVRQAVMELGLRNVQVVQVRIESYQCEEKFDTITARALASLSDMLNMVRPLLSSTGKLLAAKGPRADKELRELDPPPARVELHRLKVPQLGKERVLVELHPS